MKNKKSAEEKITEHFRELGKKSWEARKAKLLATLDKSSIPKRNVK